MILPYLDDTATKAEAANACLDVARKLLNGPDAARFAPKLIPTLEKVAAATSDDVSQRAKDLLEKAQAKASPTR